MDTDEKKINGLTEAIIGCAYKVANGLVSGFLEKVYENALAHELRKLGVAVVQQHRINVMYDGMVVGEYLADLIVEGQVVIEIKAIKSLDDIQSAQCINYLAATNLPICLLINFAPKVQIKRFVGKGVNLNS